MLYRIAVASVLLHCFFLVSGFGQEEAASPSASAPRGEDANELSRQATDPTASLHHHTSFSFDSGLIGNTLTPDQAYRFARGEQLVSAGGQPVKLARPLDFLAITDHAEYLERADFAVQGYERGVPMGGDLTKAPAGKSPTFLVRAMRDVDGANLDRIQIIKGWLGKDGNTSERIYDVALSDGRKIDAEGRCKTPVGNTVDVPDATWKNTIGDAVLIGYWKDPEFDASQRAFYYVRVIEIPSPRWTAYDAKRFGVKPLPGARMTIVERAPTSPIWFTP